MPAAAIHGYAGKTLAEKLGVKPEMTCIALKAPTHYESLFDGDAPRRNARGHADLIHLFCKHRAALAADFPAAISRLNEGGALWISWPKKTSPAHVDLTEQDIRDLALPQGLVDVKVCAVDSDWSGLKLMRRKTAKA